MVCLLGMLHTCGPSEDHSRSRPVVADLPRVDTLLAEAKQALRQQQYRDALARVDSAEHLQQNVPEVLFVKGQVFDALNRSGDARQTFNQVLTLDSTHQSVRFYLGNLDFQQGQFRSALQLYKQEIRHYPRPEVWLNVGLAYANLHNADSAQTAYQRAIALDSTFAPAYMLLGQEYKNDGQMQRALRYSLKGLALEPDNPMYLGVVGAMQYQQGQLEPAEANLKKAIELRTWDYRAHYTLGRIFEQQGNSAEAQRHLALADSLRTIQTTIAHLQRQVQENPDNLQRWIQLVEAYRSTGRYPEALGALQAAAVLEPSNIAIRNNLAYLYLLAEDTTQAIGQLQSIVQMEPLHEETWRNLASLLTLTGDLEGARRAWEKVATLAPDDSTVQAHLDSLTHLARTGHAGGAGR